MTSALLRDLRQGGNVMRTRELALRGHSAIAIAAEIEAGSIVRICNGWLATIEADRDAVVAVIHRGKLTSSSALASHGLWDGCDARIHVAVSPHAPRTSKVARTPIAQFRPPSFPRSGLVRHWVRDRAPDGSEPAWRQSITDSLLIASKHLAEDQFIACVDSALHEGSLSHAGLPRLEALLSARIRPSVSLVDSRAESGLESLARVRLRHLVKNVKVQFEIPGIGRNGGPGRVDLLVNDWLAIELDGDQWHDAKRDRLRDAEVVRRGYRSHRFGHDQVISDWPRTEATVLELLRYPPPA